MDLLYEHLKAEHNDSVPPEIMAEVEKVRNIYFFKERWCLGWA
jgi:hypothetical protein